MPADKLIHLLVGYCLSVTLGHLGYPKTGLAVGIAVGIGKEVYDNQHRDRHKAEFADFAYTAGGAGIGFTVSIKFGKKG